MDANCWYISHNHRVQDEMLFQEGLNAQKTRARKIFRRIDVDNTGDTLCDGYRILRGCDPELCW